MSESINPSTIGDFIKSGKSKKDLRIIEEKDPLCEKDDWKEGLKPINAISIEEGLNFEEFVYEKVKKQIDEEVVSWKDYDKQIKNNEKIISCVKESYHKDKVFGLFQAKLAGNIGEFYVPGDADLIVLSKEKQKVIIRIYDIKSAWEEKSHHRIQTSTYSIIMKSLLSDLDIDYSVETGIINKGQEDYRLDNLSRYESSLYERDIRELLSKDGSIYRAYKTEDPMYNLDKQEGRNFEAKLYETVQQKNIRLLGLTIGEQSAFKDEGLDSIHKIADIVSIESKLKPYDSSCIKIKQEYMTKVNKLEEEHGFSKDIETLSIKAKRMLDVFDPESQNALSNSPHFDKYDLPWIPGSGQGNLPEDDPPYNSDLGFDNGSIIRIYMNVQLDYVNDTLSGITARLTSGKLDDKTKSITSIRDTPKGGKEEVKRDEREMLKNFLNKLFEKIKETRNLMYDSNDNCPIHFYFWERSEYENLIEILRENKNLKNSNSLLNILSQREGIEQKIYSIIQEEFRERLASKSFVDGPLTLYNELIPFEKNARVSQGDFKYERNDVKVDMKSAMNIGLFDDNIPYKYRENGLDICYDRVENPDGFYSILPRFNSQVPLEYLWGAESNNLIEPDWSNNPKYSGFIENYRWIDSDKKEERIKTKDYKKAMELLCKLIHHIERGIKYRNTNIQKKKMNIDKINNFSINSNKFKKSLIDYMKLEYISSKREKEKFYSKNIRQRIISGKSIPIKAEGSREKGRKTILDGKKAYDKIDLGNPELISKSCRVETKEKNPWLLISPIEKRDGVWVDKFDSRRIKNSPMSELSESKTNPNQVKITSKFTKGSKEDNYVEWHKNMDTVLKNNNSDYYILDPQTDDGNLKKLQTGMEEADKNHIYNIINKCRNGNYERETRIDLEEMKKTFNKIEDIDDLLKPNNKQKDFILNKEKLNIVQGPPGTGKTSGTIAPAVLCRLKECQERKNKTRMLVSGPSNKSIDEIMKAVSSVLEKYEDKYSDLNNTRLIRLSSSKPKKEERINSVEYINHYKDEEKFLSIFENLKESSKQKKLEEQNIIVFSTTSSYYNLAKKHPIFNDAKESFKSNMVLFDYLLIDEASMMVMPQFIQLGAFLSKDSQVLVAGDHRQMSPVQKHEWKEEKRINIMEDVPFLSVLNYIRFLKGNKIDRLSENEVVKSPEVDINIIGLNTSYRCHEKVSNLLSKWVYKKDNINYKSEISRDLNVESSKLKPPLKNIFRDNNNMIIIVHDDYSNQQTSLTEAKISNQIVNKVNQQTKGVVTPHNAQKAMLKTISEEDLRVDTVEKYQGGEKDLMLVSATVSDPEYLKQEKEFILDPNRLNVAVSRMKKKLVIVAPKSIFKMIPNDKNLYKKTQLWKYIYDNLKDKGNKWEGKLSDISETERNINIEVYSK